MFIVFHVAWIYMFLVGVKPTTTLGELTCTMMTSGSVFGFIANFLGGWAIALVRHIYLRVRQDSGFNFRTNCFVKLCMKLS